MEAEFTVHFTPEFGRRAGRSFFMRLVGWRSLWAGGIAWLAVLALVALDAGTVLYVLAGALGGVTLLFVFLFFTYQRRTVAAMAKLDPPEVRYRVDDAGVTMSSSIAESVLPWRSFEKLWRFPDLWLLFTCTGSPVTLPLKNVGPEVLAFIARRIEESGGKVD